MEYMVRGDLNTCRPTEHEISAYPAKGFLTIRFFPANSKDAPIIYEGNRTVADIVDFVQKHTKDAMLKRDYLVVLG